MAPASVEGASWSMPGLPAEDHQDHWLAQSPYPLAIRGGSDRVENRILLHPTCHQQLHSQGLHVEKPRPVTRAERKA